MSWHSSLYPYKLTMTSHYPSSSVGSNQIGDMLVYNMRTTPFGPGWGIAGLERVYEQADERAILADGSGAATVFTLNSTEPKPSALAFVIDGSTSVGAQDFQLQLQGIAGAVRDSSVIRHDGTISVAVIQLATLETIPLTVIASDASAADFADAVLTMHYAGGNTPLAPAVTAAADLLSPVIENTRTVICVTTDGDPASEEASKESADAAMANGVDEIDAIAVGNNVRLDFLRSFVRNGSVFTAGTFQEFSTGVGQKLKVVLEGRPPGDFSTLVKNDNGTFTRSFPSGSHIEYDTQGRETAALDRNGNTTRFEYSAELLTAVIDPLGKRTTLSYTNGLLSGIRDPGGRVTRITHDGDGNLTAISDPDDTTNTFTYDERHRLLSKTSKRGFETRYSYDLAGRHVLTERPDGSMRRLAPAQTKALIDPASGLGTPENPAPPVLTSDIAGIFTDGNGHATTYDVQRLGAATQITDAVGNTTDITRNRDGASIQVDDPTGSSATILYDEFGNPVSVAEDIGVSRRRLMTYDTTHHLLETWTDSFDKTWTFERDANGNAVRATSPLGRTTTAQYDSRGRVAQATDVTGRTATFGYDATTGNIAEVTYGSGPEARHYSFTYTAGGYLQTATDPLGHVATFAYDQAGRVTSRILPGSRAVGLQYDADGNLTSLTPPGRSAHRFQYDSAGRVTSYQPPEIDGRQTATSYSYDDGGRLEQTDHPDGTSVHLGYDDADHLTSLDATDRSIAYQYYSGPRLASISVDSGPTIEYGYYGAFRTAERFSDSSHAKDNFEFEVRLEYRRGERPRKRG